MKTMYATWIAKNYPNADRSLGKCREAVTKMRSIFPELLEVKGIVIAPDGVEHPHVWCIDLTTSERIDPTEKQFSMFSDWVELAEDDPRVLFKRRTCMDCGVYFYKENGPFCSESCEKSFDKWQNAEAEGQQ